MNGSAEYRPPGGAPVFLNLLTNTRFVDVGTATPPASQNGNIESPFATLAAAVADLPSGGLLLVVPGDYTPEGTVALGANKYAICNLRTFTGYAGTRPAGMAVPNEDDVLIGPITGIPVGTGSQDPQRAVLVSLQGITATSFVGDDNLRCYASRIGTIGATSFEAEHTQLFGDVELNAPHAVTWIYLDHCDLMAAYTGGADWLVAHTDQEDGCLFTLRDCNVEKTLANVIEVDGGGTGSVQFDGATYYQWAISGSLAATVKVAPFSALLRARISTVLPLVVSSPATQLTYVDLSTVGTPLEYLPVNTPVYACPVDDIMAAGPDNAALCSARVSAPSTVRLAFLGDMNDGVHDFIITAGG
jgi:hypothetical protein